MNYDTKEISKRIEKENKRKKYLRKFFYIGIVLLFLYSLLGAICMLETSNKVPSVFGYKIFSIISESMNPELEIDDVVVIKECSEDELKKGDIVSFEENGTIITHRIERIEKDEQTQKKLYVTKGDQNEIEDDSKVSFEQIEGKYAFKISGLGKVIGVLKNQTWLILIFAIILLILGYNTRMNQKREKRRKERSKYERELQKQKVIKEKFENFDNTNK